MKQLKMKQATKLKSAHGRVKERIIILLFGLFLVFLGIYFLNESKSKQIILNEGIIKKAKVTKITPGGKGNIETIYVKIDEKEFCAGESFDHYYDSKIGDTLNVFYKPNYNFVVLKGKKSYLNTIIFEYIVIVVGSCLVIISAFYKEQGVN